MVRIEVRDGRIGRDPELVTEEGGELLASFDSPEPLEEGTRLTLPDGTVVEVLGYRETIIDDHWTQVLSVGGVFDV
jgi:urease accessory protein UreE